MALSFVFVLFGGCGLGECEDLCAARAACVAADIDTYGSTWLDWTGFADEEAFQRSCEEQFMRSRAEGTSRGDLQDLCSAEQDNTCGGT